LVFTGNPRRREDSGVERGFALRLRLDHKQPGSRPPRKPRREWGAEFY